MNNKLLKFAEKWWDCMSDSDRYQTENDLSKKQRELQSDYDDVRFSKDVDLHWYKRSLQKEIRRIARVRVWMNRARKTFFNN